MGRTLTDESPIFFVCGTPVDRHGFGWKVLYERQLPVEPEKYLDIVPAEKLPKRGRPTYALRRAGPKGSEAAVYAQYRSIQPNDTQRNRGAYIAVGCWIASSLTSIQAMEVLQRIEAIHEDLAGRREADTDAFRNDFHLRTYHGPPSVPDSIDLHRWKWVDPLRMVAESSGQQIELVFTSDEVEQGQLERFVTETEALRREGRRPAVRSQGDRRSRLQEAAQGAMGKVPRMDRVLRDLVRLEKERARIITALDATVDNARRRTSSSDAEPRLRLREAVQGAMREVPQMSRALQKLKHLAKRRRRIVKILERTFNNAPRRALGARMGRVFRTREIAVTALCVFAVLVVAVVVAIGWWLLF